VSKTIVIFGKTHKSACDYLKKMLNTMLWKDVENVAVRNGLTYRINLRNEDVYFAASTSESVRGKRYDKAYVEYGTSEEIVDRIIKPAFNNEPDIEFFEL
jgi:hypothetical protein